MTYECDCSQCEYDKVRLKFSLEEDLEYVKAKALELKILLAAGITYFKLEQTADVLVYFENRVKRLTYAINRRSIQPPA